MTQETTTTKVNVGSELVSLITSIIPAEMVDHDDKLHPNDAAKEKNIDTSIWPFARHVLRNGVTGKPFSSDCWRNCVGWAVNVPEIIKYNDTIHLYSRWWNWIGGFSSRIRISPAIVQLKTGVGESNHKITGWVISKDGVGYQSDSRYFVTETGIIHVYLKEVSSHQPVSYKPVGGDNVGWTETVISSDLKLADLDSRDLVECVEMILHSATSHQSDELSPIMQEYFTQA